MTDEATTPLPPPAPAGLADGGWPLPTRRSAAVAGAIGAAVALGVGQLASGLFDVTPSPVLAVGGEFVDRFAASLKELAVALFGTNDKAALVTGTVVLSLVLGALTGIGARRRRWLPVAVLGGFGAVGALAQVTDPQPVGPVAWIIAALSVAAGVGATWFLLDRAGAIAGAAAAAPGAASGRSGGPDGDAGVAAAPVGVARRRFIGAAGALAVVAGASAAIGRSLVQRDVVGEAKARIRLPRPLRRQRIPDSQPFTVPGASTYVTSNEDFYRIDTALSAPEVDIDGWRLRFDGMVDQPFELTYEELLALPSVEVPVTLQCVSNEVGGDLVGNAVWQGVPLADLLERAGLAPGAEQVFSHSVDGWTCGFPTEAIDGDRVALVAYAMNGEPLPVAHGFPARLVVAGLYGYVSATKWLERIELTTWDGADGYWVPRGWSKEGPIKLASRIDVPRSGTKVAADAVVLGGVAWRPDVGVRAVEVSIDGGPWQEADLGAVASANTWVTWRLATDLDPGGHAARVRAIDAEGRTQTAEVAEPAPDGATGLHEVRFEVMS